MLVKENASKHLKRVEEKIEVWDINDPIYPPAGSDEKVFEKQRGT